MKSNPASKSETAAMLAEMSSQWGMEVAGPKNLMVRHMPDGALLASGGGVAALRIGGDYVPFLSCEGLLRRFPSVTVDMGAVRFVCKGANVMRPGVTRFDEYGAGRLVCVRDESVGRFLAVGRAASPSAEAEASARGEVVRVLHYVSDRYWEAGRGA